MNPLEVLDSLNLPSFRKKQILHGIFKEFKLDFDSMTSLPKDLRVKLDEKLRLRTLKVQKQLISSNGDTIKWSFLTSQNFPIETVLMLHENGRRTLCLSCQSGCPVNCSFCWTGAMGFLQNLSSWEIIEQILVVNQWLKSNFKESFEDKNCSRVNRVVFMGMGEPMINLTEVIDAIKIILNPEYLGLSQRAVTVSTSGYIPMMKKFWNEFPKIGLAISLHAPNQKLREELMPVAKQFPLNDLISACKEIQKTTKRRATYEYILIDQVTDNEENADELIKLLEGQLAHVNLIPYNPIKGRDFKRPSRNRVMNFANMLRNRGISATARVTMGDDIKAACGQLSS